MSQQKLSGLNPEVLTELEGMFTSLDEPVYFAAQGADPAMVATAMARLSRSPDDMRFIVGKEFVGTGKDAGVRDRILNQYGDDSVAQLYPMQAVVEGASNLLTKQLEWGRLGSYLEQSTRYLKFNQRDENGRYPFFTPPELTLEDRVEFDKAMDFIFESYSIAVTTMHDYLRQIMPKDPELSPVAWDATLNAQACDAARMILPASVRTTVGIVGSAQAFENLMLRLRANPLEEARRTGDALLRHARVVTPEYFYRTDLPDRGNNISAHIANTRGRMKAWAEHLGIETVDTEQRESVELVDVTPADEIEIVKYVLFDASGMTLSGIEKAIESLSTQEKRDILRDYIGERHNRRERPGRAFEHPHYTWEFMTDYGIFRDLQRHRMVDDLRWQELTPNHGHGLIPELAHESGCANQYAAAYEKSAELFAYIEDLYGSTVAQYCTLLGHMMRWTMTENARQAYHLHEIRTSSQGHPGYRRVVNEMHRQLADVHPTIADGMKFVDSSENPGLARLEEALRNARKARETGTQ